MHEGKHHPFQLPLAHLPVAHRYARRRHKLLYPRGNFVNGLNTVMHKINLSAALQFHLHGRADNLFVELCDHGLNGHPVFRRRLNHAHIPQPHKRHMQCARNRRSAHRQHIDLLPHLLQPLFMAHAETLLLIHHQEAQVLKLDIFGKQAVRADKDVDVARLHPLDNDFLFLRRAEPRDHLDVDRELRKPLLERLEVLKAQHRRWRQHSHLLAVLHRFEGRTHSHFCFSVAHVAAQQPVHRRRRFHVVLDSQNRG